MSLKIAFFKFAPSLACGGLTRIAVARNPDPSSKTLSKTFSTPEPTCFSFLVVIFLLALSAPLAPGHDSPEHVVDLLTARMKERGKSAQLLWQRATEHRALEQLDAAAADLREAIALQPGFLTALADLGRVEFQRGNAARALQTLDQAIAGTSDAASRVPLDVVRAEIRSAHGELAGALADVEEAIASAPQVDADWYLLRSQIQLRLGRPAAAAAGLKQGFDQTGSAVLEAEWIDAMLDAGDAQAALVRIEPLLTESRCQSSWLIRRARARLLSKIETQARGDLHAAITEINERLSPTHPDPGLLLDRGLALGLLGDTSDARRDLAAARKAGAESAATWRLESFLTAAKPHARARRIIPVK